MITEAATVRWAARSARAVPGFLNTIIASPRAFSTVRPKFFGYGRSNALNDSLSGSRYSSGIPPPPTYFSDGPSPGNPSNYAYYPPPPPPPQPTPPGPPQRDSSMTLELMGVVLLSFCTLYMYVSDRSQREETAKKQKEQTLQHLKSLQLAQRNLEEIKKRCALQLFKEREEAQRREMKMALHVGLLRKQLEDAGIDPVDLETVTREFESNVKVEKSGSNMTQVRYWVPEESGLRSYVPSIPDYDRSRK